MEMTQEIARKLTTFLEVNMSSVYARDKTLVAEARSAQSKRKAKAKARPVRKAKARPVRKGKRKLNPAERERA